MSTAAATPSLLLNVDDNEAALYAKTRTLRASGFEVVEAASGTDALRLAFELQPALVLLDVKLPDISGLEVCQRIKSARPEILVLQISASFVAREDRVRGLEVGADSYLTQPVAPNELVASVRALLRVRDAERALRASEAHLQAVLASATDYAILSLDDDGKVTGWNTGAAALFGWTQDEAGGRNFEILFSGEDRSAGIPAEQLAKARADSRVEDTRWHVRRDGTRFVANGIVTRLSGAKANGFVAIMRDQTERLQAEAVLKELNASLETRIAERTHDLEDANQQLRAEMSQRALAEDLLRQSQKIEAIGQLTGGVAHDFNNLLQIVIGNVGIILRNLPADTPRVRQAAENAMSGANRAATLTQRLLAFSRRQPLMPRAVDVNKLLSGMADLIAQAHKETIASETAFAPDLWCVEADPNQLESAILNLVVNARDAMPSGGKLVITTTNAVLDQAYAATEMDVSPGDYVAISVADTGHGMDHGTVVRAFDPFFTTKDVGHGTGLGLSMVYGFVRQSGGHVKLVSELGRGTTVTLYLPRFEGPAAEEESPARQAVPEGSRADIVLVVEDDDDVRAYSLDALRELGYRVLEAATGAAALAVLESPAGKDISVLFTDVVLPGNMTGAQLAAAARRLRPDLKVLFTTGYARDAVMHHGRLDAGVALIPKPFTYDDLGARIRRALDSTG